MLHGKVHLFERYDRSAAAFIGSHNLTGFALCGLNTEAGLRIEGPVVGQPFPEIRTHISSAVEVSVH